MRTIKFRAWDKKRKKMLHWDFLYTAQIRNFASENISWDITDLMQFTGLHDKNGKEIYSGDILFNEVKNGVVQWSDKYMGWMSSEIHKMDGEGVYEVIGNVYEHPDLLKPSEGDIM